MSFGSKRGSISCLGMLHLWPWCSISAHIISERTLYFPPICTSTTFQLNFLQKNKFEHKMSRLHSVAPTTSKWHNFSAISCKF